MEELKSPELRYIYEQAGTELKEQPAFLKKLKEIDGIINAFEYVNIEFKNEGENVQIGIFFTVKTEKGETNRDGELYDFTINNDGNLCILTEEGSYLPNYVKDGNGQLKRYNARATYSYTEEVYRGKSKEKMRERKIIPAIDKEEIRSIQIPDPYDGKFTFQFTDKNIRSDIKLTTPFFRDYKNNYIGASLRKFYHQNWIFWEATREKSQSNRAYVNEWVLTREGEIHTKGGIAFINDGIDHTEGDVMRIDNSQESYTEERIEDMVQEMYKNKGRSR